MPNKSQKRSARNVRRGIMIKKSLKNKRGQRAQKHNKNVQKRRQNRRQNRQKGGNSLVTPGANPLVQWGRDGSVAPPPLRNGGWYTGPQATGDWRNVYVPPTTSGAIKNLASGNPPPGAMDQYPGAERLGNNFYATPDLKNYETTLPSNTGPFTMDCTTQKGGQRKNNRKNSQRKNGKKNGRKNSRKNSRKNANKN